MIEDSIYKLKEKNSDIELLIKFGNFKFSFNESELNKLRIRPVGKKLINKNKNRRENCYFMEYQDGTLNDYFCKMKNLNGRNFGSSSIDIQKLINIAENIRKQMIFVYGLNNNYVCTDVHFDNILYRCKTKNNLNDVSFTLIIDNVCPEQGSNLYFTTYPSLENKKGMFEFNSEDEKKGMMSWQLGILLLSFVSRHLPEFNKLNWVLIDSFNPSDYSKLIDIMFITYGEKIAKFFHFNPIERMCIFESLN